MTGDCYYQYLHVTWIYLPHFIQIKPSTFSRWRPRCRKSYSGCVFSDVTRL